MRVPWKTLLVRVVPLAALVGFLAIQLVPVDRSNPPVQMDVSAPADVREVLRRACYDCHSHETRWPWYSYVAPVSWFVAHHVEEARGDLDFSEWPAFDLEEQEHAFKDIDEQVSKGEMPLTSYMLLHPGARLTDEERDLLVRWARQGH